MSLQGVKHKLELRGRGGEPVGFARTLLSHGVAELPPNTVAPDGSVLETVLPAAGEAWVVRVTTAARAGRSSRCPRAPRPMSSPP